MFKGYFNVYMKELCESFYKIIKTVNQIWVSLIYFNSCGGLAQITTLSNIGLDEAWFKKNRQEHSKST